MMQEDFSWSVNDVSDRCEETPEDVLQTVTDMHFHDETTGELSITDWCAKLKTKICVDSRKLGAYDYVVRKASQQHQEGHVCQRSGAYE